MTSTTTGVPRRGLLLLLALLPMMMSRIPVVTAQQVEPVVVELRSYNLKPGSRAAFHQLVLATLPLLERWGIDVVGFGPSTHDSTSYLLVRSFPTLATREQREADFYGSREWLDGPREQVLPLIESFTTVVIPLDSATVAGLRSAMLRPKR